MPNHPNRNWRRLMHEACAAWLARWQWPDGAGVLTAEQLRDVMGQAYRAGYEDGRTSAQPRRSEAARP